MFGKTRQQVDIDTGGAPIIFMPAVLVDKFGLNSPEEQLKKDSQPQLPPTVEAIMKPKNATSKRTKAGV